MTHNKHNILVSANTGIGNLIQKTPLLDALKKDMPDCEIYLLSGMQWGAEQALVNNPHVAGIINVNYRQSLKGRWREIKHISREYQFSHIFMPFDDESGFKNQFLLRAANRQSHFVSHSGVKFSSYKAMIKIALEKMLSPKACHVPLLKGRHEIDLNFDLLEYFRQTPIDRDYQTRVDCEVTPSPIAIEADYVILQLGARHGIPTPKVWPTDKFFALVKDVYNQKSDIKFVLLGSKAEEEQLRSHPITKHENVINLLGKTDFGQACHIIRQAKAVIANDSGLMHISNAYNKPLIALFGPTDYTRTRPLGENVHIHYSKNEAFGYMYGWQHNEDEAEQAFANGFAMKDISVSDVIDTLYMLLRVSEK